MRIKLTLAHYLICFSLFFLALPSCKKTLEEERNYSEQVSIEKYLLGKKWVYTTESGIYHVVRTKSYGYQVAKGDTIEFWYKGYTLKGIVFDTNIKSDAKIAELDTLIRSFDPVSIIAGEGKLIEGLNDGLLQMREGEYATLLFTSSFGFGDNTMGLVEPWSPLAFDVTLVKVNSFNIQKEKSSLSGLNLTASGFSEDISSGLYYKYINTVIGSSPIATDTIYGWYKGTLIDGTIIDEISTENQQIVLSDENIPEGIRLGFMLTKVTGITDLVLPSYLGFGIKGNEVVEPYQTVFYRIRLDSIK